MDTRLVLLVAVILLSSAVMSNGIRTAGTVAAAGAPAPAVVMTQAAAVEVTTPSAPIATTDAATTEVSASSEHQSPSHGPYEDSKRKVPNGPDPIHNR
jgi:hypothetical protein